MRGEPYYDEKKRAFEALANQIDRVLNPADNVRAIPDRLGKDALDHLLESFEECIESFAA
jgi:hypothetical protein